MERALGLVEDEGIGAASDDGDGAGGVFLGVLDAGDFGEAGAEAADFLDEVGGAEFVFCEAVDVCDGFAAGGFAE